MSCSLAAQIGLCSLDSRSYRLRQLRLDQRTQHDRSSDRSRCVGRLFLSPELWTKCVKSGTGASCIYPLLACSLRPSWSFIATDIDHDSLQSAGCNISKNEHKLGDRIRLHESAIDGPLFPLDELGIERYFTVFLPLAYNS
jgi:hypothetical protein